MSKDECRALYLSPRREGKSWDAVKSMVAHLAKSHKPKLVIQFDDPDTLELRKRISELESLILAKDATLKKISAENKNTGKNFPSDKAERELLQLAFEVNCHCLTEHGDDACPMIAFIEARDRLLSISKAKGEG